MNRSAVAAAISATEPGDEILAILLSEMIGVEIDRIDSELVERYRRVAAAASVIAASVEYGRNITEMDEIASYIKPAVNGMISDRAFARKLINTRAVVVGSGFDERLALDAVEKMFKG